MKNLPKINKKFTKAKRTHEDITKQKISDSMKSYHGERKEKHKSILDLIGKISDNISKGSKIKNSLSRLNKALDNLD